VDEPQEPITDREHDMLENDPMIYDRMNERDHEQIVYCRDRRTGLRAIIAIHNTTLGPALGGMRRWAYKSEADALEDVLRLSQAMTYKAAASDLPMGGAKSVIWIESRDKAPTQEEAVAMARFVDRLGGLYIAAEDVGVNTQYIDWMADHTKHVMGGETHDLGGDPSPYTAQGVVNGMRACLKHTGADGSFDGVTVAIQGLGAVGWKVARIIAKEGASLIVSDIDQQRVDKAVDTLGATAVSPTEIISAKCDILAPCALGGVINAQTTLNTGIVAGGANNPLQDPFEDAAALKARGVVYAPDFVINAGGLRRLAGLWCGWSEAKIDASIADIEHAIAQILRDAEPMRSTHEAAIAYAQKRLDAGRPLSPEQAPAKDGAAGA